MSSLFEMSDQERDSAAIMHRLNKSLISAVYEASEESGITQKQIAERMDVNKSTISRLLQGRGNPTFRTVADVCAALGIKPDLAFPQVKPGGNIGRAVAGRQRDPASTVQKFNPANSLSFTDAGTDLVAPKNV